MSIFPTYAPPGVYTQTRAQNDASGPPSGIQIPVFIGTGKETLERVDFELIRGSSVQSDQQITREDVTGRFILSQTGETVFVLGSLDGASNRFQVLKFPIVNGAGTGTVTNNVADISVTVNGVPVRPAGLRGDVGVVTLQVPPQPGDDVRVSYFFKRTDTRITDDVSSQVSSSDARLFGSLSAPFTILAGVNDVLTVVVDGVSYTETIPAASGINASDLAVQINALLIPGLFVSADTDNLGRERLVFEAAQSLVFGDGSSNGTLGFVNGQRTLRNTVFFTYQGPIVDGRNGGITTTNPADVVVLVDNTPVQAVSVDGSTRAVTLPFAPAVGSTVSISYFFNAWQDTFDYLPDTGVTNVTRVGNIPNKADYRQDLDYVVQDDRILWGAATSIAPGTHTAGTEFLDTTQVSTMLIDNRIYLESVSRFIDRTSSPARTSDTVFVLGNIPTLGNGRDTPLNIDVFNALSNDRIDVPTNRPDLIQIYTGPNLSAALLDGPREVVRVVASDRQVTLKRPVPPDHLVWATYYYSRLRDDVYTLTVQTQTSGLIPGQYTVGSRLTGRPLYDVRFGTTSASESIQWPSGVETAPDAFVVGSRGVNETVTVTFTQIPATPALYTNLTADPYDLYQGFSDQLYATLSGTATVTDMNQAAPGVLVSAPFASGSNYVFTTSNNVLSYDLDGEIVNVTFPAGTLTGAQVAERINRGATPLSTATGTIAGPYDIISQVTGSVAAPFNIFASLLGSQIGPFDVFAQTTGSVSGPYNIFGQILGSQVGPFDTYALLLAGNVGPYNTTAGNNLFDITVNGTLVSAALTIGGAVTAATLIADLTAAMTLAGLSVGTLAYPTTNDVQLIDNAGALEIRASESLLVGGATANGILGFFGGDASSALTDFDLILNGTNVNVTTIPGASSVPTSEIITQISTAATAAGLVVGPLNVLTNEVSFVDVAGALRIRATESVVIGLQTGTNLELGFVGAASDLADNALDIDITVNGVPVNVLVSLDGGESIPTSVIVSDIAAAMTGAGLVVGDLATLTNNVNVLVGPGQTVRIETKEAVTINVPVAQSANTALGLLVGSTTASNTFDVTINGTLVNVILRGTAAGRSIPSANIATAIEAAATLAGLVSGPLTTSGNDFGVVVGGAGQLELQATQSLLVGAGTANLELGFVAASSDAADNQLIFTANGTPVTVTFTGGRQIAAATIQTEIEAAMIAALLVVGPLSVSGNEADVVIVNNAIRIRAIDTLAIGAGSANALLGFVNGTSVTTSDALSFIVNGTPVALTLDHLASVSAASVAAQIDAAMSLAGLVVGDLTQPGFNANALVTTAGLFQLQALTSLTVSAASANATLGLVAGALPANVTFVRHRLGVNTDRFLIRSRVLPSGPSSVSRIQILSGTANATLGFTSFAVATGTERAVNKAATVIGATVTSLQLSNLALQNPIFVVRIDGVEYQVTGFGAVTTMGDVATLINTAIGVAGTASAEGSRLRVTSATDTPNSLVEVPTNAANAFLGFTGRERAGQRKVQASEVAAVLNWASLNWLAPASTTFIGQAFATVIPVLGKGNFLRFTTFEEGALRSILFGTGADSAINDTGMGISVGDNASGTDAVDGFAVTSSALSGGSSGSGVVGQTYTDAQTGLRFSVLPAADAAYTPGESFTLVVSSTFLTGSQASLALPGVEMIVTNTTNVGILDTALVQTFDGSGSEPRVGDFYYITYDYLKGDFDTALFTSLADVIANYGPLDVDNPLTVAAYLAFINGASVVGCKQVLKQPGLDTAAATSYIQAVTELEKPLAGGIRPDYIVPLTSDLTVWNATVRSCEVQSSLRYRQERRAIFGCASGTRPQDAQTLALGLLSSRAVIVYPDSAILSLPNELGVAEQFVVDGYYVAAAYTGLEVSPQYDVAEPKTRKRIVGFDRLNRSLDEIEKNALAVSGVTVLEDTNGTVVVRHARTTDPRSVLTAEPSVVAIQDFVQRRSREVLDRYIGTKFLLSRAQDVETTLTGLLNSLVESSIIRGFGGVDAQPSPIDPTALEVVAFYSPIFPLNYIRITFTLRTRL